MAVKPDAPSTGRGEKVKVELARGTDAGKGARPRCAVWAVDEAVLRLTGYEPPDPIAAIYAPRPLSVRMAEPLVNLVLRRCYGEKGDRGAEAAAREGGRASARTSRRRSSSRREVVTGADGRAHVTFELPDNLTTYRVMALAVERGRALRRRQRLSCRSASRCWRCPRCRVRARRRPLRGGGRRARAGGPAPGEVEVTAQRGGRRLSGPASRSVTRPGGPRARSASRSSPSARARPTLPLHRAVPRGDTTASSRRSVELPAAPETVATYGDTRDERRGGASSRPRGCGPDVGGLELTLASTAMAASRGHAAARRVPLRLPRAARLAAGALRRAAADPAAEYGLPGPRPGEEAAAPRAWTRRLDRRGFFDTRGAATDPDAIVEATIAALDAPAGPGRRLPLLAGRVDVLARGLLLGGAGAWPRHGRRATTSTRPSSDRGQRLPGGHGRRQAGAPLRAGPAPPPLDDPGLRALRPRPHRRAEARRYYPELLRAARRADARSRSHAGGRDVRPAAGTAPRPRDAAQRDREPRRKESPPAKVTSRNGAGRPTPPGRPTCDHGDRPADPRRTRARPPATSRSCPLAGRRAAGDGAYRSTQEAAFDAPGAGRAGAHQGEGRPRLRGRVALGGKQVAAAAFHGTLARGDAERPDRELAAAGEAPLVLPAGGRGHPLLRRRCCATLPRSCRTKRARPRPGRAALVRAVRQGGGQARIRRRRAGHAAVRLGDAAGAALRRGRGPAAGGFEPVDTSLATVGRRAASPRRSTGGRTSPRRRRGIADVGGRERAPRLGLRLLEPVRPRELRDDRVLLFADQLPPGSRGSLRAARHDAGRRSSSRRRRPRRCTRPEVFGRSDGGPSR